MGIGQIWQNSLRVSPAVFGAFLVFWGKAIAAENPVEMTFGQNSPRELHFSNMVDPEGVREEEGRQDWETRGREDKETRRQGDKGEKEDKGTQHDVSTPITYPCIYVHPCGAPSSPPTSTTSPQPQSPSSSSEQINGYSDDSSTDDPMSQVTNVSQLRDVQPSDWAYEALQNLVERYGIIAGYPDGTFRGNRAMSRYEFAAGLLRALEQIQSLVVRRDETFVTQEDLATLQKLREEFVLELSLLRGDVDALTARTQELELTQFSTTTKLDGEVIFGLASIVAGEDANGNIIDDVTIFGHRTRLNLETSFTGRDVLRTRLQAEGLGALENRTLTPEGELAFTGDTDNDVVIDTLLYAFPIGNRTEVVAGNAEAADDFANTLNLYFDGDGASGALSRFATRPPIYYLVSGGGVGVRHMFSDKLELSLGYLAGEADNPGPEAGLFEGSYGAIAQIVLKPSERLSLGLTYVHAKNNYLQTGSNSANLLGLPTVSNSYGVEASFQISPRFVLGGWAGYTAARVLEQGDANIWNWAVTAAFPDLGKTGNLAGILVGMEPKVTDSDNSLVNLGIDDPSTSLHVEAFYQYQLTDNIAITPGIIWLTAPDHNSANEDIVIGTVRTTFRF